VIVPEGKLFLGFLGFALFAATFVSGCGAIGKQQSAEEGEQGSSGESSAASAGERVEIGNTEAFMWGEGDYGVVMAHGASYDAASWEEQGKIAESGIVAPAPEDISPGSLLASIEYLEEEHGVRDVALMGGSAGGSAVLRVANQNPEAGD
jgi:pimeloyl-ACP methyl ester carboxylesterase